jgi:hypothetical protein
MVVQCPISFGASQAWHCPAHAESQQTPSTQKPLAHWEGDAHPEGVGTMSRASARIDWAASS